MAAAVPSSSPSSSSSFVSPKYIHASELHALLIDPTTAATTLVVDVRDEDRMGGHVKTSVHVPSEAFAKKTEEVVAAAKGKKLVVFHCMKSQMRGPSCARHMAEYVAKSKAEFPPIAILEDGFSGWARYVSRLDEEVKKKDSEQLVEQYSQLHHGYRI